MKQQHYITTAILCMVMTIVSTMVINAKPCSADSQTCFQKCNYAGYGTVAAAGGADQQSGSGSSYAYAAGYNGMGVGPSGATPCGVNLTEVCGKVESCNSNPPES
jgi:hypothetical protein